MTKHSSDARLWAQRRQVSLQKKGPYADIRHTLLDLLHKAKSYSLLTKTAEYAHEREKSEIRDSYEFQIKGWVENRDYATFDLQVDFATDQLQIAIRIDDTPDERPHYYNLTNDGVAVDLDQLSSQEVEWSDLEKYLNGSVRLLSQEIARHVQKKKERRRKMIVTLIAIVVIGGLATAGFFAFRWWVFEPQEANNRERLAYNAENHKLDSIGYPVDAHALESASNKVFQSIPTYGGDDKTLEHPRVISVSSGKSSDWCTSLSVDIPSESNLVVAAEDDSPFIHDHYVATYAKRTLTVCLIDGFVKKDASSKIVAQLALQVKPKSVTS